MENIGMFFDDFRGLLFNDKDADEGGKFDVNEIIDESTIDEIMENEINSGDDLSLYSGSPQPEQTKPEPDGWLFDNVMYQNYNNLQNQTQSYLDEFVSDMTSLNLPAMVSNVNMEKNYFSNSINPTEQYLPSCNVKENLNDFITLPSEINAVYSKTGQYLNLTNRTFQNQFTNMVIGGSTPKNNIIGKTSLVNKGTTEKKRSYPLSKKVPCQQRQNKYKHRKTRDQPNKCYHLWDFLRDLLTGSAYPEYTCVIWTNEENREFRVTDTKMLASLWGNCKSSKNMTYDKLSRTIRYYCTLDILKKIDGKRLQFKFSNGKMWSKTAS